MVSLGPDLVCFSEILGPDLVRISHFLVRKLKWRHCICSLMSTCHDTVPVELNDELILHVCQAVFVPRSLVMVFMPIIRSYEQR